MSDHSDVSDFSDDPSSPIPQVGVIDMASELDNGDVLCGLIVKKPMSSDKKTLKRLIQKVENYIRRYRDHAKSNKVRVDFIIHPETDIAALNIVKQCGVWLEEYSISFTISIEDNSLSNSHAIIH